MSKLVTIYGGSGFVGRYIARRMAKEGWRVRVAVRRPNEAMHVKPYGTPGQVEPVLCNIRDDASVAMVMQGSDAVVNCVGLLAEAGKNTFDEVQAEGAARIARIATEQGVTSLVHLSSLSSDATSASNYARSKAEGEAGVLAHFPSAVILRPSVIFGSEDTFFNRLASLSRLGPILPIIGGNARFQPVYVDDVAQAAVLGVTGRAPAGVYELGGPDIGTLRALVVQMLAIVRRRKLILNLPFWIARINAWTFELVQKMSFGLIKAPFTGDQLVLLAHDSVVSDTAKTFGDLGIAPVSMTAVLPDYLWRFRPSGQYDAIKESAKNLRLN